MKKYLFKVKVALLFNAAFLILNSHRANAQTTTLTYTTTGITTFTVPTGVTQLMVDVVGGMGGSANGSVSPAGGYSGGGTGGAAGRVQATIAVTPGATYSLYVAANGQSNNSSAGNTASGFGTGGYGGATGSGSGGGASAVVSSSGTINIVAGGGGGGGGNAVGPYGGNGGAGGAPNANNGGNADTQYSNLSFGGGGGATQSSAGAGGGNNSEGPPIIYSASGSGHNGGNGAIGGGQQGGGGGGGYYGGGGGGAGGWGDYAGGGGGSSYAFSSATGVTYTTSTVGVPYVKISYSLKAATLNFNGSNNYVSVNTGSNSLSAPYTVEAWVNPSNATNTMSILTSRSPSDGSFDMKLMGGNKIHADIGNGSSWLSTAADATFTYTVGQWLHITYVVTTSGYIIYANGNQVGSGTFSGTPLLFDSNHNLTVGSLTGSAEFFDGNIDELRIWNRALCISEIQNSMNSELHLPQNGLTAYYKFNEGLFFANNSTVTTLIDSSGNAFNGTLKNFTLNGSTSNWVAPGAVITGSYAPVYQPPIFSISGDSLILSGQTTTLTASGATTCTWSANAGSVNTPSVVLSPTITTIYTIVAINSVGCLGTGIDSIMIGQQGAALNFASTSNYLENYVDAGNEITSALSTLNAISVEAWVNPSYNGSSFYLGQNNYSEIIGNYSTPNPSMQFLLRIENGSYNFYISDGTTTYNVSSGTGAFSLNTWQHVAGVWNGSNMMIYVNGVLQNTTTGVNLVHLNSSTTNDLFLGYDYAGSGGEFFYGSMDEVRIWGRALCQGEILNNMHGELNLPQNALLAYYKFDEGFVGANNASVNTLTDFSGNGYNGTLNYFNLSGNYSNWVIPGAITTNSYAPIFANPSVTVSGNTSVCTGTTTTLTAIGAASYTWTAGPNTATNSVNPIVNTTYSVVGTTLGCISNTAIATVTVNPLPSLTVNSASICIGNTATLTANAPTATSYSWTTGATMASITSTPTLTTQYTVTVTDINNCMKMAIDTVTVNPLPTITVNNGTICAGSSFTLSPSGAISYTYMPAGPVISPTVNTSYTVSGADANGCTGTNNAMVLVNPSPQINSQTGNISACTGNNYTCAVSCSASHIAYQWYWFTVSAPNSVTADNGSFGEVNYNTNTMTLNNMNSTNWGPSGTYAVACILTGSNGCTTRGQADTIWINNNPTVVAVANNSTICSGSTTTLTASGATTYTWTNTGATGASISPSPTVTTQYTVTGADANGCINKDTISVMVENCTTSLNQVVANSYEVTVYPNPNNGFFVLTTTENANTIVVTDILGNELVSINPNGSADININLSAQPSGVYFIKVMADGIQTVRRIIINN